MVQLLKFRNGLVISPHTLPGMWLLKLNHVSKKRPQVFNLALLTYVFQQKMYICEYEYIYIYTYAITLGNT